MEKDFYSKILTDKYGVEVIIPIAEDREIVHHCIYQELVRGEISPSSKKEFQRIIEDSNILKYVTIVVKKPKKQRR